MAKGVSIKTWRNGHCPVCKCIPCDNSFDCKRYRGQSAWQARQQPASAPTKVSKAKPELSKNKFTKNLRTQNPSISDAQIKKALKKAGYSVGCLSVLALFTTPIIWSGYKLVSWVVG